MNDWHYMRLTGKKGDSGSELLAMYSASGLGNPTTQPDLWHTNFNSETDFFMCTKVNDEEHSWGDVVKIRGEQLETYYSATGNGNPDTQSGAWHLPPAVGTDNFIIQKMETGTWGAAIRIRGINGENAVKITALSPANPEGTFSGQVGNYNGVLYQWIDSAWERIDAVTQTELTTAKNAAITAANGNVATYAPRYYGPFSSTSASGFPGTVHKGDAYLNTTDSKLYVRGSSSWVAQNAVDDTNRGMFQTALKDILNLSGVSGIAEQYGAAFVENLFADKATINELQSLSVLFKEYCGSIMSQNPQVGDTMIYMGKNPRLSSVTREFQFAISEYLGKVGQQEMWSDKLITKILAAGLLALCVSGCVQTTDGVYSHFGEVLEETNFVDIPRRILINPPVGEYIGGVVTLDGNVSRFNMTRDWKTYANVYTLNEEVVGCKEYKGFCYVLTKTKLYKTNDMVNFSQVNSLPNHGEDYRNIYKWVKHDLLLIQTQESFLYYSKDGENWNALQSSEVFYGRGLLITDDRAINESSLLSYNLEYYTYDGTALNKTEINNPFTWLDCRTPYGGVKIFDNNYIFIAGEYNPIGEYVEYYCVSLDSELRNKTLLFSTGQVSDMVYLGVTGKYMVYGIAQSSSFVIYRRNLINNTTEVLLEIENAEFCFGKINGDFGYIYFSLLSGTEDRFFITNDGAETVKEIKAPLFTSSMEAFKINDVILYFCNINAGVYDLYISRGREAGSGIIEESFGSESNYTRNSNGLITQWGKKDAVGAITPYSYTNIVINFPQAFKSSESYTLTFGVETSQPGEETYIVAKSASSATVRVYCRNSETTMPAPTLHWTAIGY